MRISARLAIRAQKLPVPPYEQGRGDRTSRRKSPAGRCLDVAENPTISPVDRLHRRPAWLSGRTVVARQPLWIVLALGIAIAALSGTTILRLHETALSDARAVTMLAELYTQTYRMLAINEEMRAESPTAILLGEYRSARDEANTIVDRLGAHIPAAELQDTLGAYSTFTDLLDSEVSLLDGRRFDEARAVHHLVDAAFTPLADAIASLQQREQAEAQTTSAQSDVGTIGTLAFSVAAIALLVAQFERIGRERAAAERQARRAGEASMRSLIENSSDLVMVVDLDEHLLFASGSSRRILQLEPSALVGRAMVTLVHPDDEGALRRAVTDIIRNAQASPVVECRLRRGDGEWQYTEVALANLLDDRLVRGIVMNARDVTDRRALERRLAHQALHDPLTGLANRRMFLQRLERQITHIGSAAMLFLDLDGFKDLNDSFGHAGGDALLVAFAERLHTALRPGDTIARVGGDEFAALLEGVHDAKAATVVAQRVIRALAPPFEIFASEVFIAASIGIALSQEGEPVESMVGNADIAMYLAKSRGSGGIEVFEPTMRADSLARAELALELRGAIERSEFSVRYQPILDLAKETIAGFEALVRWEHPTRGEIQPARFIPGAEQTGLIVPIGRFVLRDACQQAVTWPGHLFLSVNLSPRQLQDPDLLDDVRAALRDSGFPPHRLELEITETAAMENDQLAAERLAELKALGVSLAIDDFGVGYSSLGYLRRFDVDVLKLDRSFIQGITTSARELAFVTSIVQLSKLLGVRTVAEGVESASQARKLREIGCDMAQGYFFARPLNVGDVRMFITERDGAGVDRPRQRLRSA